LTQAKTQTDAYVANFEKKAKEKWAQRVREFTAAAENAANQRADNARNGGYESGLQDATKPEGQRRLIEAARVEGRQVGRQEGWQEGHHEGFEAGKVAVEKAAEMQEDVNTKDVPVIID
jgi:flagellar biosynthesis/type III secretory pathway protein FliH